MIFSAIAVTLTTCLSFAAAMVPATHPVPPAMQAEIQVSNGTGFFDQYIDHEHPELGTFKQKYWWSDEYFAGPGSPVVLFTPGETAAEGYEGYLTNRTLVGTIAQNVTGAVVMIEHRYYGESSPFQDLTVKNLQYLTLKNAIADMTHFARTVKLSFDKDGRTNAPRAPWVMAGGSYSGALSAWTEATAPGTFWAYHSSSAPVEAIYDYWQYFYPVQQGMPKNCSADVTKVITYIDTVLFSKNATAKHMLKSLFGLSSLQDDDFASALQNGPWLWQSKSFTTGYSPFYQWCDYIENAISPSKPSTFISNSTSTGVSLPQALSGYATWMKEIFLPNYCASFTYWTSANSTACFDTHNARSPQFTDRSVNNTINRQWNYMLCAEPFGYWQTAAPTNTPSIISRLVTPAYWQRQCDLFFPPETGADGVVYSYGNKSVSALNAFTKGWSDRPTKNLLYVNGEFDPWRTSGVSSQFRPAVPGGAGKGGNSGKNETIASSATPVLIIPDGGHCSDLSLRNAAANPGVRSIVAQEVAILSGWVRGFYALRRRGVE